MKIVTSEKDHECRECHKTIPAGYRHIRNFKWEVYYESREHANCEVFSAYKNDERKKWQR